MRELVRRVWYVINKRRVEADLAEEMEFIARGGPPSAGC